MESVGIDWTADNLDDYLKAPNKFIPKHKMPFGSLKKSKRSRKYHRLFKIRL